MRFRYRDDPLEGHQHLSLNEMPVRMSRPAIHKTSNQAPPKKAVHKYGNRADAGLMKF